MRCRPAVVPLAQVAETGAGHILGYTKRSDRHQPTRLQVSQLRQPLQQLRGLRGLRLQAGLRLLGAELHFDQNRQPFAQLARRFIQPFGQPQRIHRIHGIEKLRRP